MNRPDDTGDRWLPRLAIWFLGRVLPRGPRGDTVVGDLLEERQARGATTAATLRFWRQALSVAVRYRWRPEGVNEPAPAGVRSTRMSLDNLLQDVRYAVRSYAKAPSFALTILVTLALGIGASTAIFSMVNGILLRPLPLPDPDTLVYANEINTNRRGQAISVSWPNYLDWRARAQSFTALALTREEPMTLTGVDRPQRLRARRVTGNFFAVVGIPSAIGRTLGDEDDRPNAAPTAVVSAGFWQTHLGGDASALGRALTLDATAYTVVGVMPPDFEYLRPYDVFVSMGPISGTPNMVERGNHSGFSAVGRLKSGVALDTADSELKTIASSLEREYPGTNSAINVLTSRLADRLVDSIRLMLLALFGAVGLLLLIACVNVANLLIARGAGRQHELAVRAALGGGRGRLATQLLVESTLVSICGGTLGIGVAAGLVRMLVAMAPEGTPRLADVGIDGAALLFAFGAAAVCGIVFGALPAFQASAVGGQQALVRGRSSGASARTHRLRRGLMAVETALALILLTGAGLMMRTLQQLTHVDTGIRADHLLTAQFMLAGEEWTPARRRTFYDDLVGRVRALPGVGNVALAGALPIDGSNWNSIFIVGDQPVPERAKLPSAAFTPVSDGYFATMGMRLMSGRLFVATEKVDASYVVIVNETFARKLWPGQNAVGKRLKQGWPETPDHPTQPGAFFAPWREVVGVVSDVKFNGIANETPMQAYLPLTQIPQRSLSLVVRSATDPVTLASAVEGIVRDLDRNLPLFDVRTMEAMLSASMARERMSMLIFAVFAVVALTLASVGLYGVVAHGVTERTHEIGVRMALGAGAHHVLGLVVRQGLSMALIGTAIGVAGAVALSRWIEALLFGVSATDPATFAIVVGTLLAVAAIACYIPAWRATRVDPTTALRAE